LLFRISCLLFLSIAFAPPGQPYRQNTTIGPTIVLEPGQAVIAGESFEYDDPSLPEHITGLGQHAEKSYADLHTSCDLALQIEADGDVLWNKVVDVIELARKAKFKRVAFLYLISPTSPLLGQIMARIFPPQPPALIVILADAGDKNAASLKLPEILPWRAAFVKLQRAADRGKPLRLEAVTAAPKIIIRRAPNTR